MKNGLASSAEGSGQLLLNLVGSGKSGKSGKGASEGFSSSFKDIVNSILKPAKSSRPNLEPSRGKERQNDTGSGILDKGSKTQGWYAKVPHEDADTAKDRLKALVEEGTLDEEELNEMSEEAVKELVAWLLSGADGMFEPVGEFAGEGLEAAIAEAFQTESDLSEKSGNYSEQHTVEFSSEGDKPSTHEIAGSGKTLLENLSKLDELSGEEKELLSKEVKALLLEQLSSASNQQSESSNRFDSSMQANLEGDEFLQEMLSDMSKEDIAKLLQQASKNIGKGELFVEKAQLEKLPRAILEALSVKLTKLDSTEKVGANFDDARKLLNELASLSGRKVEAVSSESTSLNGNGANDGLSDNLTDLAESAKGFGKEVAELENHLPENEPIDEIGNMKALKPDSSIQSNMGKVVDFDGADDMVQEIGKADGSHVRMQNQTTETVQQRYVNTDQNIEKISQAMKMTVKRGITSATLQLSPAELGKVKLQVSVNNGVMSATIRTESADTRNMLLTNVNQLRDTLTAQGIKFGEFDIHYENGESSQNTPEDFTNQFNRRRGSSRGSRSFGASALNTEEGEENQEIGVIGNGFVNMIA